MYDQVETSAEIQEYIAVLMAHELAHQWFGNLVTMKWWNDIWLNEGAATFFEYKGVNHIWPEWGMMDLFILHKTQRALELDALANSHPISVPVENPTDIESIFDTVSYFKGASILYMLERVLCENVFKRGLNDYLTLHAYGNTVTNDLWEVFTKHTRNSSIGAELDVKVSISHSSIKVAIIDITCIPIKFNAILCHCADCDEHLDPTNGVSTRNHQP